MQPDIRALVTRWVDAFNRGAISDLAGLYTPEARIVPPGRPAAKGIDEIGRYFVEIRAQGFRDYQVDIQDTVMKDDFLIASGRWALVGLDSDGSRNRYEGNWLNVLDREDEAWKIVVHMWN